MVTKLHLAKELKKRGRTYREASIYLRIILDTMIDALSKGQSIQLRGLGTFGIKNTPEKAYPSLLSGKQVIPAHGRIVFKPSKELRKAVWNHHPKQQSNHHQNLN